MMTTEFHVRTEVEEFHKREWHTWKLRLKRKLLIGFHGDKSECPSLVGCFVLLTRLAMHFKVVSGNITNLPRACSVMNKLFPSVVVGLACGPRLQRMSVTFFYYLCCSPCKLVPSFSGPQNLPLGILRSPYE